MICYIFKPFIYAFAIVINTVIQTFNLLLVFKCLFSVTVASEPHYRNLFLLYATPPIIPSQQLFLLSVCPAMLSPSPWESDLWTWTFTLSLCVLITGPSVKHQRPSSPAGLCCQTGLRYRQQIGEHRQRSKRRNTVNLDKNRNWY